MITLYPIVLKRDQNFFKMIIVHLKSQLERKVNIEKFNKYYISLKYKLLYLL